MDLFLVEHGCRSLRSNIKSRLHNDDVYDFGTKSLVYEIRSYVYIIINKKGTLEVDNTVADIRTTPRLQDLSPIEALIMELRDPEQLWAFEYTTDDNGHVNFLFTAPYRIEQTVPPSLFVFDKHCSAE
jgi:hypothetical protein